MGGWKKKRGVENLTNDTPPKKSFGPPLVRYVFHPPQVSVLCFFLYTKPRQSRPEALLEGSTNFRESAFSGTFSSPHTFCNPPYHGPRIRFWRERFQTPSSVSFCGPRRAPGREHRDFLLALVFVCLSDLTEFSQNSVSSSFRNSTFETVFRPCPARTVPEGHKHRVTTPEKPRKIQRTPAEPRRALQNPRRDPRRALRETPAERSERQISSESLAEGCAPRMVTLRNFRTYHLIKIGLERRGRLDFQG